MRFEFATAGRIFFGPGTLGDAGAMASGLGRCALIVCGSNSSRARPLLSRVEAAGLKCCVFETPGEPTIGHITNGVNQAREFGCDIVIGFGGGSVIDSAKAIAGLATNAGDIFNYLEVIGKGKPLTLPGLTCIAIPTTAGTGAEVTRNAVLASPDRREKVSLRSPFLLPRVAIVDPELTYQLPPAWTAFTGLDALTQLIEPYVSIRANPIADAFCIEGISRAARSLQRAFDHGEDRAAREGMALASLLGGLALANSGLGAVHGFAAPIGGMFAAPHGAICAALLPHVMEINVRALRERVTAGDALLRYDRVAALLTGKREAGARDGINWVTELCDRLQVPRLRTYGVTENDLALLVKKAAQASSMKANPIVLTNEELTEVLQAAW
ncbi:MAG: iron-containing alcohol dehydrogenase [Verrucomicrobia bacterium]|jgi:alcohol dehydrogenase class IV|nr:iron-containing alcohol dehydrogenase [Verrucomicrobiota bacterium]